MRSTLRGLGRWCLIGALALLLAILTPLIWVLNGVLVNAALRVAEPASDKLRELWREAVGGSDKFEGPY